MKRIINILLLLILFLGNIVYLTLSIIRVDGSPKLFLFIFLSGPYLILFLFNKIIKDQMIPNILMLITAILLFVFGLFLCFTEYSLSQTDIYDLNGREALDVVYIFTKIIQYALSIFGGFISGFIGWILSKRHQKKVSSECPFCGESVQDEAIYCRYCKNDLPAEQLNQETMGASVEEGTLTDEKDNSFSKQGIVALVLAVSSVIFGFFDLGQADSIVTPLLGLVALILGVMDLRAGNKRLFPMVAVIIGGAVILLCLFILI